MNETLRYLLFGLTFIVLLLIGMAKNWDLLCYLSAVVLGPWILGLLLWAIITAKERIVVGG